MRALTYTPNPLGWATCWWLKRLWRGCLLTRINGLRLRETDPPELPAADWVRVRTRLAGICGTDVALLRQAQPPDSILQAFSSLPIALGHENVAEVTEVGPEVDAGWVGKRVVVEPTLGCRARGIDPLCDRCAAGEYGACENFGADGAGRSALPPGSSIGYNSRTGGAYGDQFVSHVSQLVELPEGVSDEQGVLVDAVACSLHAVLRADLPGPDGRVLVYGLGTLGLAMVACLRAVGYGGQIHALGRSGYTGELARSFGADAFVQLPRDQAGRFERIAELTGGRTHRVRFGNRMLSGGYDVTFDLVGSSRSTQECLKWTRARGTMVMVATAHGGNVDLTPVWFRELHVVGAYGRQSEHFAGRRVDTYRLVLEMMQQGKLDVGGLLTHTFGLDEYKRAFAVAMDKGRHQAVKVGLDFR